MKQLIFLLAMDTIQSAVELLEKSSHIAILLPADAEHDCLVSAEVLSQTLEGRGKLVGFVTNTPSKVSPSLFPKLSYGRSLPKEFVVSLDTSFSPVAQLRYEKGEGKIDIIFSPKQESLKKEAVSFRDGKMLCDSVIAIGVPDIENSEIEPHLLSEVPILNIDISPHNKQYGEINLVSPEKSAVSETVYELLTLLCQEPLAKDSATLVLSALIAKTNHFSSAATSADVLLASSELLRLGADLSSAQHASKDTKSSSLVQFLGRASVRSRLDEEHGVLWSFITAEDFEKTGRSPADIALVTEHIRKEFPPHRISALLWQNPEDSIVRATLAGKREILETLEARGAGKFQSPHLLLSSTFQTFREAEEIVASLLDALL